LERSKLAILGEVVKITFVICLVLLLLISCVSNFQWKRSTTDYNRCLRDNAGDRSKCEEQRRQYESDIVNLRSISEGPYGGLYDR